jgi:opacity protein-like surface antigen
MRKLLLCTSALAFAAGATSASAADLGAGEIVEAPVYVAEGFSWNGLYFGGSIGWAWHDRDDDGISCAGDDLGNYGQELSGGVLDALFNEFGVLLDSPFPDLTCAAVEPGDDGTDDTFHLFNTDSDEGSDDGWMASVFLGVNRQYGNFVVGTELEGVWLDSNGSSEEFIFGHQDGSDPFIDPVELLAGGFAGFETDGPDWMAQGTVKGGWLFGSRQQALLYVKGGFAVADTQESSFDVEGFGGADFQLNSGEFLGVRGGENEESGYGFGGTLGAGLEYKLTQNFSVGAEYQATFLNYSGSHDVTFLYEEEGIGEVREATISRDFGDILIQAVKVKATLHFN